TITASGAGVADLGNVILGDSGALDFTAGVLASATSTDVAVGDADVITTGSGNDVIVGGVGGDTIYAGEGANVVLGDTGSLQFDADADLSTLDWATSRVQAADGVDMIVTGTGRDVIVGGQGGDTIKAGDGENVVLGDYGQVHWVGGLLDDATSLDTNTGGND